MTDSAPISAFPPDTGPGELVRERSVPRRTKVVARVGGELKTVDTCTQVGTLLPAEVMGARVVGALLDDRPVSLDAPLLSDARLEPLSMASWDGREIYRRSVSLLLLEAAQRAAPKVMLHVGPSLTTARVIRVEDPAVDRVQLAADLLAEMQALVAEGVRFREELWSVEEARAHFATNGWEDAALLLRTWRDATVALVSCGRVYAFSEGPVLVSVDGVVDFKLTVHPEGLLLDFGSPVSIHVKDSVLSSEHQSPRYGGEMVLEERRWLASLGVTGVGSFDVQCISGGVRELIRVSEGFHEKRIGRIADAADARKGTLRVVTIAGPSSSGKTTFIKRLSVQLEIVGLRPVSLSLDDYYVDRDKTRRDAYGELDFEAFEALDHSLFTAQVKRLFEGETVTTARYDFVAGKSLPSGGAELRLGVGDVLLLEGIHGSNPALLADAVPAEAALRIFVQPAMSLAVDRLTSVSPADVRLIRRIVRDRHQRGYQAADTLKRWPAVRIGEMLHILPYQPFADMTFDSSLVYELGVLKVYAERYLLEVPAGDPSFATAYRLRRLLDKFVAIYPEHVPPTSLLREFIGGSSFDSLT